MFFKRLLDYIILSYKMNEVVGYNEPMTDAQKTKILNLLGQHPYKLLD
tara:strand:- start:172 stop:315 length:144 start_codon:yes stop_codon:yes gene_type:complete